MEFISIRSYTDIPGCHEGSRYPYGLVSYTEHTQEGPLPKRNDADHDKNNANGGEKGHIVADREHSECHSPGGHGCSGERATLINAAGRADSGIEGEGGYEDCH